MTLLATGIVLLTKTGFILFVVLPLAIVGLWAWRRHEARIEEGIERDILCHAEREQNAAKVKSGDADNLAATQPYAKK